MVAAGVFLGPAAHAQEGPAFTTPSSQTSVPVDTPFEVAGTGCAPGSTVTIQGPAAEATATADEDGTFVTTLTVPASEFDPDAEPADVNEFTLKGTCEGVRFVSGVLVAEVEDASESDQVDQVPSGGVETGAGGTAPSLTAVGAGQAVGLLAFAGLLLAVLVRRHHQRR